MKYYINKITDLDFESAVNKVTVELQKVGFGIVTIFDLNKTFKDKLGIDFRPYTILGACNPPYALESINAEDKIGTLLPCNVMLQGYDDKTEIAVVDPEAMMFHVENEKMKAIASDIKQKLVKALNAV